MTAHVDTDAFVGIETCGVGPDLDEHLLRHFLGHRRVAQHPRHGREDHRCHGVVDLGEGCLVAALHPVEERREVGGRGSDQLMMPGMVCFTGFTTGGGDTTGGRERRGNHTCVEPTFMVMVRIV